MMFLINRLGRLEPDVIRRHAENTIGRDILMNGLSIDCLDYFDQRF